MVLICVQARLFGHNSNLLNAVLKYFATYIELPDLFLLGHWVFDFYLDILFKFILLHKSNASDRALFFNVIVFINAHNVIVSIWLIKEVVVASFVASWALVLAFSLRLFVIVGDRSNHSLQRIRGRPAAIPHVFDIVLNDRSQGPDIMAILGIVRGVLPSPAHHVQIIAPVTFPLQAITESSCAWPNFIDHFFRVRTGASRKSVLVTHIQHHNINEWLSFPAR